MGKFVPMPFVIISVGLRECVCPVMMQQQSPETAMAKTLIPFWSHVANDARNCSSPVAQPAPL